LSTATVPKEAVTEGFSVSRVIRAARSSFLLRRLGKAFLTVIFVTTLIFFLVRLMPSSPVEVYINELILQYSLTFAQARDQAASLFAIDLDAPLLRQYLDYMAGVFQGDLGTSLRSPGTSVTSIIARFLPWTIFSVGTGLLISFSLGMTLGMLTAYYRDAFWEPAVSAVGSFLSSIPDYIIGILLLVYLGVRWELVPIHDMRGSSSPGIDPGFTWTFIKDIFFHAALPIATYVMATFGGWMLTMKSNTISTLGEDYVTVARARGLTERRITTAYVGRNASLPLVAQLAINIGFVMGGSILIEFIFVYQGIGYQLRDAINTRDYSVMQGIFLIITIAVILSNLLADYAYGWLDPRIRIGGGEK
jgi:peptide/nickel transport system permease protein